MFWKTTTKGKSLILWPIKWPISYDFVNVMTISGMNANGLPSPKAFSKAIWKKWSEKPWKRRLFGHGSPQTRMKLTNENRFWNRKASESGLIQKPRATQINGNYDIPLKRKLVRFRFIFMIDNIFLYVGNRYRSPCYVTHIIWTIYLLQCLDTSGQSGSDSDGTSSTTDKEGEDEDEDDEV